MTELLPGTQIPSRTLDDEHADIYVDNFRKILRAARLNSHYPDGRGLAEQAGVFGSHVHRGLYKGLEIDERTGLPTYKEWTRAQTDITLAANQLVNLGSRELLV